MRFSRPRPLLAGFHAASDEAASPLVEAGEQWAPRDMPIGDHANLGWEIYYQARGSSNWQVGQKKFRIPAGGCYLIAPGVRHTLLHFAEKVTHFYFAVFYPGRLGHPEANQWPRPFSMVENAHTLETPFRGLMHELVLNDTAKPRGIACYLGALCVEIDRSFRVNRGLEPDLALHPASVLARDFIHAKPEAPWKLEKLAKLCHVSVPHLAEVFRRDFGEPPRQYLLRHRIELAAEYLRTSNQSITEIALELGFSSSQHFANVYRKFRGKSPRQERSP